MWLLIAKLIVGGYCAVEALIVVLFSWRYFIVSKHERDAKNSAGEDSTGG